MKKGKVHIVGAGPGDPELMTRKAERLLREADVVVYDRLVHPNIIKAIPKGIARIYAGKSCKSHHMTQDEINHLLAELARSGKQVVRLKGGDPFIFGRGGEEAEYLNARNIAFDVIPGVTSASGCGAYAGIPLTHRGLATGVRYFTGHLAKESLAALDWKSLADPDTTLVVYMGLANLETIAEHLIEHGLPSDFPAAVIENGTTEEQRVIVGTLSNIFAKATKAKLQPPTLAIIGRVVTLRAKLAVSKPRAAPRPQTAARPSAKARRRHA